MQLVRKFWKNIGVLVFSGLILAGATSAVSAATLGAWQGGTGIASTTAGNVGNFLRVSSSSPFLTYDFGTLGVPATTTINGFKGSFFNLVGTDGNISSTISNGSTTFNLANSGVTAGSYTNTNLTVDAFGRITVAANGSAGISTINIGGVSSSSFQIGANLFISSTGTIAVTSSPIFSIVTSTLINFTNATGTRLFASVVSSTGITFTNATGSGFLFSTTVSSTNLYFTNASGSGIFTMQGGSISSTNISVTNATATRLTDSFGNQYSTSTGGTPAGSDTYIQFNSSGKFDATSTFIFSSSTQRLWLNAVTSSIFIGTNSDFATSSAPGNASSVTFSYTGATSSWQIPAGVTSITINALGSKGGHINATAGKGGSATGTLAVTAGTTYYYCVGGSNSPTVGGYCGGGASFGSGQGASGGGMSWFGTSGQGASDGTFASSTASTTIILVAGGGGGDGVGNGGDGGGTSGTAGGNGNGCVPTGGGGGTQTGGGTAGVGCGAGTVGQAGQAGRGGAGGPNVNGSGGGGGAGWFGGGGGGDTGVGGSAGGGGGSSFTTSTLSSTSTSAGYNNATGSITITYTLAGAPTVFSTSSAALYIGGHIFTGNQNATIPTISACGSSPTLEGNDTAGMAIIGTGVITSCTITFGQRFSNPPACVASDNTSILAVRPLSTTSTLVLSTVSTFAGDTVSYWCPDY